MAPAIDAEKRRIKERRKGLRTGADLKNGGALEKAAAMANHASTRTTQFYDRRRDEASYAPPVRRFRRRDIPVRGRTANSKSLIGQIMSLFGRVGNFSGTA